MERYYSYSRFIKEYFGEKLYKMAVLPVQTVMGHSQLADVSFAAKGEAENLQRTLPSLFPNRFILVSHRLPENIRANITLLTFRHLPILMPL